MKQKKNQKQSLSSHDRDALNKKLDEIIESEAEKKEEAFPMSIVLCMGVSLGMVFGLLFDNITMGVCIGAALGLTAYSIPALSKAFKKKNSDAEITNKNESE